MSDIRLWDCTEHRGYPAPSSDHARLAPSSAYRWVECPASVQLQEQYPDTSDNEEAAIGTAAHEVADVIIRDFLDCGRRGHHYTRASFLGQPASNGVIITDDILDGVEVYVRDVLAVSNRFPGTASVLLEYRVYMPMVHAENWGTLDSAIMWFDHNVDTLVLSDFKFGRVVVEAWENWQLLDYALGILYDRQQRHHPLPNFIEFRLCQPRAYHPEGKVRTWTISLDQLAPYAKRLYESATEALGPNPRAVAGLHCTHCSARHKCATLNTSVSAAVGYIGGMAPMDLTPAEMGARLTFLRFAKELISAQLSGLEDTTLATITSGVTVPGWEWVRGEGRQKWTKPLDHVKAVASLYGVANVAKESLITPKQAIDAGLPEEVVATMSSSEPGKAKVQPVNLKRVQSIFNKSKR